MFPLVIAGGMLVYAGTKWYQKRHILKSPISLANNDDATADWTALKQESQIATSAMTLMVLGRSFFPILTIPALLGFSYLSTPLLQRAYHRWQQQKQFDSKIILSLAMPALLLNGYYLSASLSYWLYSLSRRSQWFNQHIQQLGGRPQLNQLHFAKQVWVLKQGVELQINSQALHIGDVVRLNANSIIPADGVVIRGKAVVDELGLGQQTQNRQEKMLDAELLAGSVLMSGQLYMQVKRLPQHSFAARVQQLFTQSTAPVLLAQQTEHPQQIPTTDIDSAMIRHLAVYFASLEQHLLLLHDPRYPDARTLVAHSSIQQLRACLDRGIQFNQGRSLALLAQINKWVIEPKYFSKAIAKLCLAQGLDIQVLDKKSRVSHFRGLPRCRLRDCQTWRKQGLKIGFIGTDLTILRQAHLAICSNNASHATKAQADIMLNLQDQLALKQLLKLRADLYQQYLSSAELQRLPGVAVYGGIFLIHASTVAQTKLNYPEDRGWLLQLPMPLAVTPPKKDYLFEN